MNPSYDVIILGGGVIGCSTAYQLAKKGRKVLVIDQKAIGGQTSSVAAGMLAAQEESSEPGPLFDLCVFSRDLFKTLVPEIQNQSRIDPEYEVRGVWSLAETEAESSELLARKKWQEARGLAAEWWSPERVKEIYPDLKAPFTGAFFSPQDGQINSPKWVQALAEAARAHGAHFAEHVSDAEIIQQGDRVTGVRTASGVYASEQVLLAAGPWTSLLFKDALVSIEPVKGQVMVLGGIPHMFRGPLFAGGGYLTQKVDGSIIIGSTMEKAGFDVRPTLAAQQRFADWVTRWFPDLSRCPVVGFRAGLRPATADGLPVMGPVLGRQGLFVSTGHYRNGVLLSAFSGLYMAEGMTEDRWSPLGNFCSPDRFAVKGFSRQL